MMAMKSKMTTRMKTTRDINSVVRRLLIIGLIISTMLMVLGVALDLILHRSLPTEVFPLSEAFGRAIHLRPSGFFSLGLMALILTPVLQVLGSIIVFIWEGDRRYAAVTLLVLAVMIASVFIGEG
jgi:uncharacterized membrane protein